MADNRNFVNKFANQGGGDIFVEDAKLSEISTKTAIASEGVMLKGTDGAYYEIDKASLSEVIRAELGAILADNSKNNGTSVAKVPTLNSSGNALGASSVADLASVLGVPGITSISNSTDINSYSYKEGISAFHWGGAPVNAPTSYCLMLNIKYGSRSLQIVVAYDASQKFYYRTRDNNLWREWRVIDSHTI